MKKMLNLNQPVQMMEDVAGIFLIEMFDYTVKVGLSRIFVYNY